MTLIRSNDGRVRLFCDSCEKQTPWFSTEVDLYSYVKLGARIDTDDGAVSWVSGVAKIMVGSGFQPLAVKSPLKHACASCKGSISGLVYTSEPDLPNRGAQQGAIGRPDVQVSREDAALNKDIEKLFQGGPPTPASPHSYPRREPGLSTDKVYEPLWNNEDGTLAAEEGTGT